VINDEEIGSLRRAIDDIDSRLLALLAERLSVVHQVGEEKRDKGLPVFDPVREERLLKKLIRAAPEEFDEQSVRNIFAAIVGECRRLEALQMERDPKAK
jgi:3-deoxy-7-phosphoheptulonate synthase/chorismate mutase